MGLSSLGAAETRPGTQPGDGQTTSWPPGTRLGGGTYEVRRQLGSGGMGEVYEAYDHELGRLVAIKTHHPWLGPDRLRAEARALAACRHPGVAAAYALCTEGGLTYLVMERVYGLTLGSLLAQRSASRSPLTLAEVVDLLVGLAEAVGAIHAAGVAHRDLKPENILLAPGGRVVIIDFSIFSAECAGSGASLVGTPGYMAPEAILEAVLPGRAHLLDLYSIGAIAFQALTGNLPFPNEGPARTLERHASSDAPDVASLRTDTPPALATLVNELLRREPSERPQDIGELTYRLRAIRGTQGTVAPALAPSVLVVDDDPTMRMLVERAVRRAAPHAEVTAVADGDAALRVATRAPPRLILLDLELPGLNGLEVCLALRGTRATDRAAIVLVSGRAKDHDVALLRQLGVRRFVEKGPRLGRQVADAVLDVLGGAP